MGKVMQGEVKEQKTSRARCRCNGVGELAHAAAQKVNLQLGRQLQPCPHLIRRNA